MRQSKSVAVEIRSRIAEMLRCRMSGQINQMLKHFGPNTVVHCASSRDGLLPPGIWEGADGLRAMTRRTDENYEPLEHEILDILVDGSWIAMKLLMRRPEIEGFVAIAAPANFADNGRLAARRQAHRRSVAEDHQRCQIPRRNRCRDRSKVRRLIHAVTQNST